MTVPDVFYVAFIAVGLVFDHFVLWPAFVRRSHADAVRARAFLWSSWIGLLWTLAVPGAALWVLESRAWGALRLTAPHGWRLWGAIALVAALAIASARRIARIARSQRRRRIQMGAGVERLVPHTGLELPRWIALSITAGCCEEFLFRGYLIWVFQPLLGLWGAAALSLAIFAAVHAYQGAKGAAAAGAVGAVLTVVVLAFGSLWPAIVMHAVLDIGEGLVAWLVMRKTEVLPTQGASDLRLTA